MSLRFASSTRSRTAVGSAFSAKGRQHATAHRNDTGRGGDLIIGAISTKPQSDGKSRADVHLCDTDGLTQARTLLCLRAVLPPTYDFVFAAFAFILGASIGSFLNVCIYRMPLDLSV